MLRMCSSLRTSATLRGDLTPTNDCHACQPRRLNFSANQVFACSPTGQSTNCTFSCRTGVPKDIPASRRDLMLGVAGMVHGLFIITNSTSQGYR